MRYLPPKGTAGLLRSRVSGKSRSPLPPARMKASTRARVTLPPGDLPQLPQPEHTTLVDALEAQGERPRAGSRATVWLVALAGGVPAGAPVADGVTRNPR